MQKPLLQASTISTRTATTVMARTARPQPHVGSGGIKGKPKSYLEKVGHRFLLISLVCLGKLR
jgi:hypothetical protein